jgi:hypothetical protein
MKRLKPHLTPSTAIAIIALVFALTGGAFAASSHGGGNAPAKASASTTPLASAAKSKPKPKAKPGPRGPAGPAGKNGTNGANGAPGATGPAGPAGPAGGAGPQGLTGNEGPVGHEGKEGPKGKEGALGTAGVTLPKGASETGVWAVGETASATPELNVSKLYIPISFPIPLAAALIEENVHVFEGETPPGGCEFVTVKETIAQGVEEEVKHLKAAPGNLCVHVTTAFRFTAAQLSLRNPEFSEAGAGTDGAVLESGNLEQAAKGYGTWAVTAP